MVDKTHRNQCRACRLNRCVNVGMNRDAVQHERGPRNSTLRRQMSLYFRDQTSPPSATHGHAHQHLATPTSMPSLPLSFPNTSISTSTGPMFLAPPSSVSPPSYMATPIPATRPSPPIFNPGMVAPPLTPPMIPAMMNPYHLHLSFLNEARRNHGLLMPTPKYPHEFSPPASMPSELVFPPPRPAPSPPTLPPPPPPPRFSPPPTSAAPPTGGDIKQVSDGISEFAARLLFMNVKWTQNIPAFTSLPYRDQMLLLEESWRELFVLNSAQFALPVELAAQSIVASSAENELLLSELKNLQDAIQKFQAMNVDMTEFACLRAIILLKTHIESNGEDQKELRDQAAINSLQDQAQLTLSKYISNAYPTQPSRFGKLLLLLPSLKAITGKAIEELFFKKTIGAIPIEKIICDMYKGATAAGGGGAGVAV